MEKMRLFYLFLAFMVIVSSCRKEDEVIDELTLERNEVTLLVGDVATVKVKTGNEGYVVKSKNETVAVSVLKDGAIVITGKGAGETDIDVTDKKGKKAIVKVVVKPVLSLETGEVSVVQGDTVTIAIKGGTGKYTVTSSNEKTAKVTIGKESIKIEGLASGTATITITDTETKKTQEIKVVIKPVLSIDGAEISVVQGDTVNMAIKEGSGKYTVVSSDEKIAKVFMEKETIRIKGVAVGTTTITVTDTETKKTQEVKVIVKSALSIDNGEASVVQGETITLTIKGGTGKYTAMSSDEKTAKVTVEKGAVKVKGIAVGTATIIVTDTETKKKQEIKVIVKSLLSIERTIAYVVQGEFVSVGIKGGTGKYTVMSSDEKIAKATVEKDSVKIEGVAVGKIVVTLTDAETKKTQEIRVFVQPVLSVEKTAVSVDKGSFVSVAVNGGSGKYAVTSADEKIAKVSMDKKAVKIEGVAEGKTTVTVMDTETKKEVKIDVTVSVLLLRLAKTELAINQGETEHVAILNTENDNYSFTVEPMGVITVEKGGTLHEGKEVHALKIGVLKYGTATVTVKSGKQEAKLRVSVNAIPEIKLSKDNVELYIGAGKQEITINKGNGSYTVQVNNGNVTAKVEYVKKHPIPPYYAVIMEGKQEGSSIVTIKDIAGKTKTVNVTVKSFFNISGGVVTKKSGVTVEGNIVLPDQAEKIPGNSNPNTPFNGNEDITSVDFNKVTEIGGFALFQCKGLKTVRLRNVSKIESAAFFNCEALSKVYCYMDDPSSITIHDTAFKKIANNAVLYVPKGKKGAYEASQFSKHFSGKIQEM